MENYPIFDYLIPCCIIFVSGSEILQYPFFWIAGGRYVESPPVSQREGFLMAYSTYLKSKDWKNTKSRFYSSKLKKTCFVCGSSKNINIHHKSYKTLGHENLNHLIALCRKHHFLAHEYLRFARLSGFTKVTLWSVTKKYKRFIRKNKPPDRIKRLVVSRKFLKDGRPDRQDYPSQPNGKGLERPRVIAR